MKGSDLGGFPGRPGGYWLIVGGAPGWTEALTLSVSGAGETLPVFSFKEEADMFLWHVGLE